MPNKKARTKVLPEVDFDLPPSAPSTLPTIASISGTQSRSNKKRKRKAAASKDDTPKAFTRLLARADPTRPKFSSLDDGTPRTKKQKNGDKAVGKKALHPSAQDVPATRLQIGPNESLKEFSRRVDAAMPVKFPKGQGSMKPLKKTLAERQIAHEMAERERLDAERSETEDEEEDVWAQAGFPAKKVKGVKGKKGKKGKADSDDEDPWKVLEEKRGKVKFGEVAEAPPQLKKPRAVFRVHNGAAVKVEGVPKSAGSLMRREELAGERAGIVEAYRKMMEEKRGAAGMGVSL
ncbi:hypothetical protein EX30DRAFT_338500 [Ascodesmis nigricans]|uniref:Uncharacterized protein n=1 Tax=Ascodesmis nigricans TaxID=341454 RepID=A0A4V3SJG1_9PEZI|nr:hypothetical protein EX30DRAFT_338500 [Ascodesmis nigricans]